MARSNEATNSQLPAEDDQKGYRHFGDGIAGPVVASRLQGYYSAGLTYVDVATDVNGNLLAALAAGSNIEIGTVDQGAAGASAWLISGSVGLTGGTVTATWSTAQPISGTVTASWSSAQPISGTVTATGSVTVSGSVAVTGGTIGTITNSVPVTGSFYQVTQPVSGTVTTTGSVAITGGTIGTITNSVAVTGTVTTTFSAPQHVIIDSGTLGTLTNSVTVIAAPATSGGLTPASGTIGNAATTVKASAGQVYGWYFFNNNTTPSYVQFFNTTASVTTVGTSVPVYSLGVPANSGATAFAEPGIAHSAAIVVAITTTRAGATSPTNTVDYNVWYD